MKTERKPTEGRVVLFGKEPVEAGVRAQVDQRQEREIERDACVEHRSRMCPSDTMAHAKSSPALTLVALVSPETAPAALGLQRLVFVPVPLQQPFNSATLWQLASFRES